VSPGDAAAENQLLYRSCPPDHPDAGPAQPWDEQVPPPGRDATLLAVVPIPGTASGASSARVTAGAWSPSTASATSTARGRRDEAHGAAEYLVWHTGL